MPHPNVELMKQNDEAMQRGDMDAFFAFYTDDVLVHARGNNKLTGDYQGKEQMQDLFGRFMEAMGSYSFEAHSYLADDEHGVILQTSRSERDGKTLEVQEAFVMHFRGNQVSEM